MYKMRDFFCSECLFVTGHLTTSVIVPRHPPHRPNCTLHNNFSGQGKNLQRQV